MTSPRDIRTARVAADNGEAKNRWQRNQRKNAVRTELNTIEQLSERVGVLCNAQTKLAEVIPGYRFDEDGLRAIRLAIGSIGEALGNVERLSAEIDQAEFNSSAPNQHMPIKATYGNDLTAVEEIMNDLGVQANAESYTMGLVDSRRRPGLESLAMIRHLYNSVRAILG